MCCYGTTDYMFREEILATQSLAIVHRQEAARTASRVVEVSHLIYPRQFGVRTSGPTRQLKMGEITRFVQNAVDVFFTQTLSDDQRHQPVDLYELKGVIAPDVERWVRRFSHNPYWTLSPWKLAQMIRTMEIGGIPFRIEGSVIQFPEGTHASLQKALTLTRKQ